MTTDWRELRTIQEVAAAQANDEEIEHFGAISELWRPWDTKIWSGNGLYRSRPRKQTKTVVLREGLMRSSSGYYTQWFEKRVEGALGFIQWLDTPERTVEVDCDQP